MARRQYSRTIVSSPANLIAVQGTFAPTVLMGKKKLRPFAWNMIEAKRAWIVELHCLSAVDWEELLFFAAGS
jgi:hypothetical protein